MFNFLIREENVFELKANKFITKVQKLKYKENLKFPFLFFWQIRRVLKNPLNRTKSPKVKCILINIENKIHIMFYNHVYRSYQLTKSKKSGIGRRLRD